MHPNPPNIVLVTIDSLRADHCGFLGDDRGLTPEMDALAAEGVAFENAVAPGPQTFSSMPAVFTGYHRPPDSLNGPADLDYWARRLASVRDHVTRFPTVPERLRELGYATAGVTPNPWTSSSSGFGRGFDHFTDLSGRDGGSWSRALLRRLPDRLAGWKPVELGLDLATDSSFFSRWETLYADVIAARDRLAEPYFLWVFLLDAHFPFLASRAHREEATALGTYLGAVGAERAMRGRADSVSPRVREATSRSYRDAIRAVDAFLAALRSDLAADEPVFVVHADHGESLGDHGNYGHHHRDVYEENVHVPFLVHGAGVAADVREPTSLTVVPDVAERVALTGSFDPRRVPDAPVLTTSECGTNRAVRGGRFKYVERGEGRSLFDLRRDPDERSDVSAAFPQRRHELRRELLELDRRTAEIGRLGRAARAVASADRA